MYVAIPGEGGWYAAFFANVRKAYTAIAGGLFSHLLSVQAP
ncbi:hypothetical protein [Phormidium sp. CCY1219]|nr:hypothetical protein [Phormidium sp. CCY1219]